MRWFRRKNQTASESYYLATRTECFGIGNLDYSLVKGARVAIADPGALQTLIEHGHVVRVTPTEDAEALA